MNYTAQMVVLMVVMNVVGLLVLLMQAT